MTDDFKALLKRVIELCIPNLRGYYRVVRKAKIVNTRKSSKGNYWADVQPLRNDNSVDEKEPVVPKVEIPVLWAGPERGLVCPPLKGTFCDLSYYDGDPDYPRISNFRWHNMKAPECEEDQLILQKKPGVFFKIHPNDDITIETPGTIYFRASKISHEKV